MGKQLQYASVTRRYYEVRASRIEHYAAKWIESAQHAEQIDAVSHYLDYCGLKDLKILLAERIIKRLRLIDLRGPQRYYEDEKGIMHWPTKTQAVMYSARLFIHHNVNTQAIQDPDNDKRYILISVA